MNRLECPFPASPGPAPTLAHGPGAPFQAPSPASAVLVGVVVSSPAGGRALILAWAHSLALSESAMDPATSCWLCPPLPSDPVGQCLSVRALPALGSPFSPDSPFLGDHLALAAP